jgi:hypothetical protein
MPDNCRPAMSGTECRDRPDLAGRASVDASKKAPCMKETDSQQPSFDGFRVACWLTVAAVATVLATPFMCMWLPPAIVGTIGVYCAMKADRHAMPNLLVAFSLVIITPAGFFSFIPVPMVPVALLEPDQIPGLSRMPMKTTAALGLVLIIGGLAAWGLAASGNRCARRCDQWTKGTLRYVVPFPLYVLMFLVYHFISAVILEAIYLSGLCSLGWDWRW